jgi:aquaporin Z
MEKKERIEKFAPLVVSALITLFITFESPYSGMSINPARTFASAIVAGQWTAFWLYCVAPVVGMWAGTSLFLLAERKIKYEAGKKCR